MRQGQRRVMGWLLVAMAVSPVMALAQAGGAAKPETHITPDQAKALFASVDELAKFAAEDSGLPLKHEVKRKLTSRAEVEEYLRKKFDEDEDSKRMQRSEIVLKKFGLLDRDFDLKPFMLALLKEQIAGYYDSKTKTIYLLDWLDLEAQKPVLAHELTHALQDQHTDLEKWSDQTPEDVSHTVAEDNEHLERDEMDTARDAVLEGQAMAVFLDYSLKPTGRSLVKNPEIIGPLLDQMDSGDDSPVLARAPLLLSQSLLFPYKDGLSFEQDMWMDKGQTAAFAGVLDHPPSSSWAILNPRGFEKSVPAPVPIMPDVHALLDKEWAAYDIGQVGALDVRILAQILGGEPAAKALTPAWDGGIYWAGRKQTVTVKDSHDTAAIALMYLSQWKSAESAAAFAQLYAEELPRKYAHVKRDEKDGEAGERVYETNEGPVVIRVEGRSVFVAESFPVETADKLARMMVDAQGTGEMRMAGGGGRREAPGGSLGDSLSGSLVRLGLTCGVMKAALSVAGQDGAR